MKIQVVNRIQLIPLTLEVVVRPHQILTTVILRARIRADAIAAENVGVAVMREDPVDPAEDLGQGED